MSPTVFSFSILLLCFCLPLSFARDKITLHYPLTDYLEETLISPQEKFELGFFNPDGSSDDHRRYVGIWYYGSSPKTVVWVANRDNPLNDSTGVFGIGQDGNLMLSDGNKQSHWSTVLEGLISSTVTATLLESGNLVLRNNDENGSMSRVLWNSFDHPTDTFLPGMKMNENLKLVSWKTHGDPAKGAFQFEQEIENQYKIMKEKSNIYWKSVISGKSFYSANTPPVVSSFLSNSSGHNLSSGSKYPNVTKNSLFANYVNRRLVMNFDGKLQYFIRDNHTSINSWSLLWVEPLDNCSVYKRCGVSSRCNSTNNGFICKCLPGFEPILPDSWASHEFSEGCKRRTPLCSNGDNKIRNEFFKLNFRRVREPSTSIGVVNKTECMKECLNNCKCQAYSYRATQLRGLNQNATCSIWSEDLNNIQEDKDKGYEIYLRVVQSDIGRAGIDQIRVIHGRKTRWPMFVTIIVVGLTILLFPIVYVYVRRRKGITEDDGENTRRNEAHWLHDDRRHAQDLLESGQLEEQSEKGLDVHFFGFDSILVATDNFSEANMLGKGGFGPVYKGKFSSGQEIAVKRLSSLSGQGHEEFKNEVMLIARLQHRNLVRLLGYCIEGGEKILLYEYMPNKSLDYFVFDPKRSLLLDWEMRFNIILGIARGLMYLHQDSRLRIIHRDLKTSNILLDGEMNPKISDFGLARIFEGKQTEGVTRRVVGTYGYMSPEYALDGFFSIKSDVFSFGVVVLEIVSGKRSTGCYDAEEFLSLLGYTWKLWQEDKALDLMDENLKGSSKMKEILKCINIALLCVQEDPNDRPIMSEAVIMLSSETRDVPSPKQPAFVVKRRLYTSSSSSSKPESHAQLTCTVDGR